MDTKVRRILVLSIGGIVGGVIGYWLGGLIVNSLREEYEEEVYGGSEDKWIPENDRVDSTVFNLQANKDDYKMTVGMKERMDQLLEESEKDQHDYTRHSKTKKDLEELASQYKPTDDNFVVVSLDQFSDNEEGDIKETFLYYEQDATYTDSTDEVLMSPEMKFGPNPHLHFGELSEDEDVVYIRDTKKNTKYEILRMHDSYASAILGEETAKPKPRRRHVKKVVEIQEDEEE